MNGVILMSFPYKEKISYLTNTDNQDDPVGKVLINDYPITHKFRLQALFFNFSVSNTYQVESIVRNGDGDIIVKSNNDFSIDIKQVGEDKYTDKAHDRASAMVGIETPYVNVFKNDAYEFELNVFNSNGDQVATAKTYVITYNEVNDDAGK